MASQTKLLRRLPGRGRATFGLVSTTSVRLYLEGDHLFYVANDRFTESYKRFYFRDIQALILCRTNSGKTMNVVMAGMAACFAALGLASYNSWGWGSAGLITFGAIAAFFLLLLIVNVAKGPTCLCQLKTAVHTEELPSLNRIRSARKALALLIPEIETAQGQLMAVERPSGVQEPSSAAVAEASPAAVQQPPQATLKHEQGRFHGIASYLLLVDSVVTGLDIFYNNVALTLLASLLGVAVLAATVMALVRQQGSDLGHALRSVVWIALGYQATMMMFGFIFTIYLTIKHRVQTDNQWEMLRLWSQESALDSPWLFWTLTVSAITSLVLGVAGLALLGEHRRKAKAPPRLASSTETPAATS